jgi:hypothetical protein
MGCRKLLIPHGGERSLSRGFVAIVAVCVVPLCGAPMSAHAFGAMAVGQTTSIVKDGIAMGTAWRYATSEAASKKALSNCHNYKSAPRAAAECRVIATFHSECYAISLDPKAGTPGAGWAIASDEETAKARALAHCKLTAGKDRSGYCEISESNCDDHD